MKHMSYQTMAMFMVISGLTSTMNTWVNRLDDIRFSLNDAYMILLMTSVMLLLMSIHDAYIPGILVSGIGSVAVFLAIRYQLFITESQFIQGMIPHHSMAIHMASALHNKGHSKKLLPLVLNIKETQQQEIDFMKGLQ